jgi:diguanylate cyclase (GGDEF)-like protein
MTILALSWVSSMSAWALLESQGKSSPVLRWVFGANAAFHPAVFLVVWRRCLSLRWVDLACLLFAAGMCSACMALRLYSPTHGGAIDLQPLYLWIPVIYVFAFTLRDHRWGLRVSLAILALFVVLSVPYLLGHLQESNANFTLQMLMVSAVLIGALYFFASYQQRFLRAQLTVDELARLANTDVLTQVANRRRMSEALAAELERFGRYGHAFSIILIDIDHFKAVNDLFGHAMGDQSLVALAARVAAVLRHVDTLGRWGGEEFLVILPETGFDESLHKAAAMCAQVAAMPLVAGHTVTISCGVSSVQAGDSVDALLQRADEALYAAKRLGRNRAEGAPAAG